MRHYIVTRRTEVEWDEMIGVVVCAFNSRQARRFAASRHGDEGASIWLDPKKTSCRQLDFKVGVILRSFNAG